MSYPDGVVPTLEKVHPTPVYETILFAGLFVMLWLLRKNFGPGDGRLFALYLITAGILRFFLEYVRTTPDAFLGLTAAQVLSVVMTLVGVGWLGLLSLKRKRAAPNV